MIKKKKKKLFTITKTDPELLLWSVVSEDYMKESASGPQMFFIARPVCVTGCLSGSNEDEKQVFFGWMTLVKLTTL